MKTRAGLLKSPRANLQPGTGSQKIRVKSAVFLLLAASSAGAFAQGKVSLQNDAASPITLDSWNVLPADIAVAGQAVATTGPLPSGIMLSVGLYAGTSSTALGLVSSEIMNPGGGTGQPPGAILVRHIILPFPGGGMDYFQVRVWNSAYTNYEQAFAAGTYTGENNIFTMTPGTSIVYPSIISGGGSTWTAVGNESPLIVGGGGGYPDVIIINAQPTNQMVLRGHTANFAVSAYSTYGNPLSYQWRLNGLPIPYAIGSFYQISNVQPANEGTYSVMVWDAATSVLSAPATLTVLVPPTILTPPQSQTAELGAGVGFDVNATGDSPLRYQWFFNSTNALAASGTNSHLQLTNVQFSQSGAYSVAVTNGSGAVTSPPALLNVIPVVPRQPAPALTLNGALNSPLNLEYTPVLNTPVTWLPLDTVLLTNASQPYVDTSWALGNVAQRFYRAWQTNQLGPRSTLGLNLVPAITVAGSIGSTQRVDYISQYGPVDAWVTLAAITITNTSQLYFDTSVIGQPPRLYRIVPLP